MSKRRRPKLPKQRIPVAPPTRRHPDRKKERDRGACRDKEGTEIKEWSLTDVDLAGHKIDYFAQLCAEIFEIER